MNPYEVLGVSQNATDQEIRNAYRNLVKQFHPDVNNSLEANDHVARINAAYEVLSDAERRARYDHPFKKIVEEFYEDPIEAHKREFKRKQWEKEQRAREKELERDRKIYVTIRALSFPILFFALTLVVDDLLPRKLYKEIPIAGWQRRTGGTKSSPGVLLSYLQTQRFYMRVPHHLHLNYPYDRDPKPPVDISVTPIFDIPRTAAYTLDGIRLKYTIQGNIHSISVPLKWLLLVCSGFVVGRKQYSMLNHALSYSTILLFVIILIIMW